MKSIWGVVCWELVYNVFIWRLYDSLSYENSKFYSILSIVMIIYRNK